MSGAIPTITAFARSPDRGRGLARDMRVRWALEEAGLPYDVRLEALCEEQWVAEVRSLPAVPELVSSSP